MIESRRTMITGASGQLGSAFRMAISSPHDHSMAKDKESFNLLEFDRVRKWTPVLAPDVILNCAGFTDPVKAEQDPQACYMVNVRGVENLALVAAHHNVPFIHFSSSDVFGCDPYADQPYTEDYPIGPLGVYGQSKAAGEHAILNIAERYPDWQYYIVRTSCLYEKAWRFSRNFCQSVLMQLNNHRIQDMLLVDNARTSLTYVPHLVEAVQWLIEHMSHVERGIWHIADQGTPSWFAIASEIRGALIARSQPIPGTKNFVPVSRKDYAARLSLPLGSVPGYTALSTEKWQNDGLPMPTWQTGIHSWVASVLKRNADSPEEIALPAAQTATKRPARSRIRRVG